MNHAYESTYVNYKFEKLPEAVRFSAQRLISMFKDDFIRGETPICWDNTVSTLIGFANMKAYTVWHKAIPLKDCTSITDYKKVWKLLDVEKGEYDTSYTVCNENSEMKIYVGIKRITGSECSGHNSSNVIIYIPYSYEFDFNLIFENLKEGQYDFSPFNYSDVLSGIATDTPGMFILHYSGLCGTVYLTVYGKDVVKYFDINICNTFPENSESIYRRGIKTEM